MLRPATPLSALFLTAFALLLLSVLSTPIIKAIPLGSFGDFNFGVFGFCKGDTCSPMEIGYDTSGLFSTIDNSSFDLPSGARKTLSAILIVHPVAAGVTLLMSILALVAHLHSPSHSSRYLLLLFIFGVLNFLVCMMAFLVDVLVFVPHMAWGAYITLAAAILVAMAMVVACAMRRTIVSRKARKRRIAENAEMSGQNYYSRQAQTTATVALGGATQPAAPSISGANGADMMPGFGSVEKDKSRSSDERIPLTAQTPSDRLPHVYGNEVVLPQTDGPYNGPGGPNGRQRSLSSGPSLRDEYGNPIQPQDAYGMRRGPGGPMRGRGGMPPGGYRGRGSYPGPGRGGFNGYGPPPGGGPRGGGYGPQGRGGYGPSPRGGYGPPPSRAAFGGGMRGGRGPPPSYGAPAAYEQRGSQYAPGSQGPTGPPGAYGPRQQSPGPAPAPGYDTLAPPSSRVYDGNNPNSSLPSVNTGASGGGYNGYTPADAGGLPRAESPPPLPGMAPRTLPRAESPPPLPGVDDALPGQVVAMNATTGSAGQQPGAFGQFGVRDSDADIAGMLALQQARLTPGHPHDTFTSDASRYSQDDQYLPPRQNYQGAGQNPPRGPSPVNTTMQQPARGPSPLSRRSPAPQAPSSGPVGGEYYEDIDPRFAEPSATVSAPGPRPTPPPIQPAESYDEIPQGARSPAESERSNFTSISQRGINPRWNPGPPPPPPPPSQGGYGSNVIPRRPVNRPADVLLSSNPDFELPGRGSPPRAQGGMIPGSAYPAGPL